MFLNLRNFKYMILLIFAVLMFLFLSFEMRNWKSDVLARSEDLRRRALHLENSKLALLSELNFLEDGSDLSLKWASEEIGAAVALIQNSITNLAAKNAVQIRSVAPGGVESADGTEYASFAIDLEARLDDFSGMLRSIEGHNPAIFVEQATLRRISRPGDDAEQPLLGARLVVSAPLSIPEVPGL